MWQLPASDRGLSCSDQVHTQFFASPFRSSVAQLFHSHSRLDLAKEQLHYPAPEVEFSEFVLGVNVRMVSGDRMRRVEAAPAVWDLVRL